MLLGTIDLSKKPDTFELFLAKPNRNIIAKITDRYDPTVNYKLGGINELSFTVPYRVDRRHRLVDNPLIPMLKEKYLIKARYGSSSDWFIITRINENMNENSDEMQVECMLLPYQLTGKLIRDYQADAKNATTVLSEALQETTWNTGYIDADFDTTYRSFDVSSKTLLDFINEIAETFKALIVWDTELQKISLYNPDNVGINRGLRFNYGHYLKTMKKESNTDEMVTRLKIYGDDTTLIEGVNPTGQNYIEDYSYFIYPFERDENGNVIKHSDYMSDELCIALLNYQALIESQTPLFSTFLTNLHAQQAIQTAKKNEYDNINTQVKSYQNQLDIANSTNQPTAAIIANLNTQKGLLAAKQAELDTVNAAIATINGQIATLRNTLKTENNFTVDLLKERAQFIIEKEWTDYNYINPNDLLADAKKKFKEMISPQLVISIDIVNFKQVVQCQRDWDKLHLGDIVTIYYERMNVYVQAKIIEINVNYDKDEISLTIANVKELKNDKNKFIEMLYKSVSTSTTVDMSKLKWNGIDAATSTISQIINNTWDVIKADIAAGVNQSVTISDRGLIIKNPDDPLKYLVAQNGVLAITNDGGNTWKHAITSDGFVGERIYGKLIAGTNLTIDASDTSGNKTFTVDSTGVKILGTSLTITNGLPESQINGTSVSKWNAAEANAKSYTDGQLVSINTTINELSNDGKLTGFEKQQVKQQWDGIVAEKPTIEAQGAAYSITTEKTDYVAAYNALSTYLAPLLASLTTTSDIDGTVFRQKFTDYINKRQILLKSISDKSVQLGGIYNGVVIDTTNGLTVTRSDSSLRTRLNATEGITIAKNTGTQSSPVWSNVFYADTSGNLNITGNITANSGTFNGVIKATDFQIGGQSILSGNKIDGKYIDTLTIQNLVVGNNVTMGANAYISWSNVTSKPTILTSSDVASISSTTITSTLVSAPTIQGATIKGGTISANTQIDVGTNLYVGDNIYLTRGSSGKQSIVSAGTGSIEFSGNTVKISASGNLNFAVFTTYNGEEIATKSWVTANGVGVAKFA